MLKHFTATSSHKHPCYFKPGTLPGKDVIHYLDAHLVRHIHEENISVRKQEFSIFSAIKEDAEVPGN